MDFFDTSDQSSHYLDLESDLLSSQMLQGGFEDVMVECHDPTSPHSFSSTNSTTSEYVNNADMDLDLMGELQRADAAVRLHNAMGLEEKQKGGANGETADANQATLLQAACAAAQLMDVPSVGESRTVAKAEDESDSESSSTSSGRSSGRSKKKGGNAAKAKKNGKVATSADASALDEPISTHHPDGRLKTEQELREERRKRRLLKNRESAQLSRQRKKKYIETLEKQVSELNEENNQLHREMIALQAENRQLRSQNQVLQGLLAPHANESVQAKLEEMVASQASDSMDDDDASSMSSSSSGETHQRKRVVTISKPSKSGRRNYAKQERLQTTGMVLVVLFSVGMLMAPGAKKLKNKLTGEELNAAAAAAAAAGMTYEGESVPKVEVGRRVLLSVGGGGGGNSGGSGEVVSPRARASPAPMEATEAGKGRKRGVEDVAAMLKGQLELNEHVQASELASVQASKKQRLGDGGSKPVMIIHEEEEEEEEHGESSSELKGGCAANVEAYRDQPHTYVFCGDAFQLRASPMDKARMEVNAVKEELHAQGSSKMGVEEIGHGQRGSTIGSQQEEETEGGEYGQGGFVRRSRRARKPVQTLASTQGMGGGMGGGKKEDGEEKTVGMIVAEEQEKRAAERKAMLASSMEGLMGNVSGGGGEMMMKVGGGLSMSAGKGEGSGQPLLSIVLPYKAFNRQAEDGELIQLTCEVHGAELVPSANATAATVGGGALVRA